LHQAQIVILLVVLAASCSGDPQSPYPEADAQGIDGTALAQVVTDASAIEGMKWILVSRHGVLVAEEYFNGQGPDSLHDVRSVTKSVTSALVGIAIREGFINGVGQTLADYLGGVVEDLDPAIGAITIEDLLTMRAGHDWHEIPGPSEFPDWVSAPDQIQYILDKPLVDPPGTHFNYSDGSAHLTSVVLSEATETSALAFAEQYLFDKMDIGERPWSVDNRGYNYGGVALRLSGRDMLAFGQLYLEGGAYNGDQLVPAQWVSVSTQEQAGTDNAIPYGPGYGYYWWVGQDNGREFYFANGYGGQFIFVVRELNLVVVTACEWRWMGDRANEHWYDIIRLVAEDLLPIVQPSG
jgi:CubicO group peptidase (beta-lactamase class C family)